MSKRDIKDFLDKFSDYEDCDKKNNSVCDIIYDLKGNIDNIDLDEQLEKDNILNTLNSLKHQDGCDMCQAIDGFQFELSDKWKDSQLGHKKYKL